ncbi:UNVERIFIED_CONTAM: protein REPRESSOR OF SILENCING 3 [Sesamum angustifolium]|uniref:Protein REPRESSOR OF SILENCING 3 n=1 Tax=Sesamum angustifolium TaxID=2727405 RepID=A0AAW2MQM3_9LAMI
MGERLRIYVGGLGSSVQEDDLRKTFTSPLLGAVESVEIIRSKGRSFAYLGFVPSSDKGLAKLFSTYNGCMWKGGKLKLEKAKEHYLLRLRREWAEDAELETKLPSNVDADESVDTSQKPLKDQDIAKMQLNIFFPKLRKIKPIPLRGSGKHKYSFQRVEVPPLPIHFCDCEEHSGPPESAERNCTDHETETYGVNEDELNMMKSILDKLLEKENYSKTIPNEDEFIGEVNHNVASADEFQVDDNDEDQVSDEDNLVINIVGQPRKRVVLSGDREQKVSAANQDSLARTSESLSSSIHKKHGSEKGKLLLTRRESNPSMEVAQPILYLLKERQLKGLHMTARVVSLL